MTDRMKCPRRVEDRYGVFKLPDNDFWFDPGNVCSYCGSLHPDDLMGWLDAREVQLIPTDKNYKVYVDRPAGTQIGKFYFQHLSSEQQQRFVHLLNDGALSIGYPGHFYALPFFIEMGERR